MLRYLLPAALLVAPLAAQDRDTTRIAPRDSADAVILDISVDPAANERHTAFLQKGVVYRAYFSEEGVILRMRSPQNKQLPYVVDVSRGPDATGGTEFEVYPQADADVEFSVVLPAQVPVHFRLVSDSRATERGRRSAEEGYWELGLDALVGWHPDLASEGSYPVAAGRTVGGCLSVRNGAGPLARLHGCIGGLEWMGGGIDENLLALFTEPRIRVFGGGRDHSHWGLETGLVARLSVTATVSNFGNFGNPQHGFGAYVALDQRSTSEGKGWRFTLVGRMDRYPTARTASTPPFETKEGYTWLPGFQFGFGRYW